MDPNPGDVILTRPEPHSLGWKILHPFESIPAWGIQRYQRADGFQVWQDTHAMLFLGPDRILSVTYPETKWERWAEVSKREWSVYRPAFALDGADVDVMWSAAQRMIGSHYDVGQLLDIALNKILGYNVSTWHRLFDQGARRNVCSVGVRTCFERARQVKEAAGIEPPFRVLFEKDGQKLHVERTCPANFANTPGRYTQCGLG